MSMRPAGRQHSVTIPITPVRTSSDSLRSPGTSQLARAVTPLADAAVEEVKLSPAGFETSLSVEVDQRTERQRHLAVAIRQRIESRLGGRVRDLAIRIRGETIVLEGRCSTFYTKQLAQHAALGVLDEEQLENAITVTM
jgi:hypothetical protein